MHTTEPPAVAASAVTLDTIRAARERIRDVIYHSPCPHSFSLSRLCGSQIYCKLDHLQMTGSFKERGARNKLLQLRDDQKKKGVIAASAGNHAQALAYHGGLLKIPVTVVMPKWAPLVKVTNCRQLGAEVLLTGESFDEARAKAGELAGERQLTLIPGFDDPDIIAGQGTLGLEILEDVADVDAIIVPVGGGGLIAGIGTAVKALRPSVQIIGVEAINAPTLYESLKRDQVTKIQTRPTLADGLAVAQVGHLCFAIAKRVVDDLVMVDEAEIARAILRLLELEKMVVEGGGATSLAAAMRLSAPAHATPPAPNEIAPGGSPGSGAPNQTSLRGKKVVLVLSGGNIDVTTISKIIDRGLAADGRLCRITAYVSDRPGSLAHLTKVLAATGASVKEVEHDRHFGPADVALVGITCVLETRGFDHIEELKQALRTADIQFVMK